jgi:hypothetical protein
VQVQLGGTGGNKRSTTTIRCCVPLGLDEIPGAARDLVLSQNACGKCCIAASVDAIEIGAFGLSPESVWYARVLFLFSASAMTDTGSKCFDCAFVSTLGGNNVFYTIYMY